MRRDAVGLQVTLDVEGRHALVVGGDAEAADKAHRLLEGGAWVTVVAAAFSPGVQALVDGGRAIGRQRPFLDEDVATADLVFIAEREPGLVERARAAAEAVGAAVWACDAPESSHLAMPALARCGRVRFAVSTGGTAPALASRLRAALERDLGGEAFVAFVERLAGERARLFAEEPDPERRRAALRALVDGFDLHVTVSYPPDPSPTRR